MLGSMLPKTSDNSDWLSKNPLAKYQLINTPPCLRRPTGFSTTSANYYITSEHPAECKRRLKVHVVT